jgi:hypothetical protein
VQDGAKLTAEGVQVRNDSRKVVHESGDGLNKRALTEEKMHLTWVGR